MITRLSIFERVLLRLACALGLFALLLGTPAASRGLQLQRAHSSLITGRVTRADTGAGVEGIGVAIRSGSNSFAVLDNTTTDASGLFTATAGEASVKVLFVDPSDAFVDEWYPNVHYLDVANWRLAGTITTTAPNVGGIDVALESAVVLTGTISDDASALPLQDAGVQAFSDAGVLAANTLADAGGNFVLRGLLPGPLRLRALSPLVNENVPGVGLQQVSRHVDEWHPDQAQFETAQRITVTAATQAPVPVGLKLGAVITGNVLASDTGFGVSQGTVFASSCLGFRLASAGAPYQIAGLAPAPQTLLFSTVSQPGSVNYVPEYWQDKSTLNPALADPLTPTLGITRTGVDAVLQRGNTLVVRLVDGAGPPVDSQLFTNLRLRYRVSPTFTADVGSFAAIGGAGYSTAALADGDYTVGFMGSEAFSPVYYPDASTWAAAQPLALSGGESRDITLTVSTSAPTGRISGLVTSADLVLPMPNVQVTIYRAEDDSFAALSFTDGLGRFGSTRLLPGQYYARFETDAYAAEYSGDANHPNSAQRITVTAGVTATANASLERGGVIEGIVTAAGIGLPLSKVSLSVFDADGSEVIARSFDPDSYETTLGGRFRTRLLKAGQYLVRLGGKKLYRYPDCAVSATYYPAISSLITVTNGSTADVSQTLPITPPVASYRMHLPLMRRQ